LQVRFLHSPPEKKEKGKRGKKGTGYFFPPVFEEKNLKK